MPGRGRKRGASTGADCAKSSKKLKSSVSDRSNHEAPSSPVKKLRQLVSKKDSETEPVIVTQSNVASTGNDPRKCTSSVVSKYFKDNKDDSEKQNVTVSKYFSGDSKLNLDEDSQKYLNTLSSKVETLSDSGSDSDEGDFHHSKSRPGAISLCQPSSQSVTSAVGDKDCSVKPDSSLPHVKSVRMVQSDKMTVSAADKCSNLSQKSTKEDSDPDFESQSVKIEKPLPRRSKRGNKDTNKGITNSSNVKDTRPSRGTKGKGKSGKKTSTVQVEKMVVDSPPDRPEHSDSESGSGLEEVPVHEQKKKGRRKGKGKQPSGRKTSKSAGGAGKKAIPELKSVAEELESSDEDGSESEEDWEEVEDMPEKSQIPDKPVEIILKDPSLLGKKRKGVDVETLFKRHWNKLQREHRINLHKSNLVCLIGVGFQENSICNDLLLQAIGMSCLTTSLVSVTAKKVDSSFLSSLLRWFKGRFTMDADTSVSKEKMNMVLTTRFETGKCATEKEMVFLMIVLLRCLKINTRLVMSLQPIPLKPPKAKNSRAAQRKSKESESLSVDKSSSSTPCKNLAEKMKATLTDSKGAKKMKSSNLKPKNTSRRKCASKVGNYNEDAIEIDSDDSKESSGKGKGRGKRSTRKKSAEEVDLTFSGEESDSDLEVIKETVRGGKLGKKRKKILSSGSEDSVELVKVQSKEKGTDHWLEVYMEKEKKWICVDCIRGTLDNLISLEKYATQPLSYVLAYDNYGFVRDVTPRYASAWSSETRKLRVEQDWWEETLLPYRSLDEKRNKEEDETLHARLLQKPLPTSVAEFKNHPLYALKRHLLKFQAIYPESSVPVGYIKGEPVYARDCVHELHSRDNWLKEARLVRIGETPYKMVRARKTKKNQVMNPDQKEVLLEIFGYWQTEEYIPKPAVDGKLPKNEYGNIELFKPTMLPAGTVHLKLSGLNKIGKKLNLDTAPAMVGWENHGGWSHPLLDGFIVCEEHKDIFISAWDEEQEIVKEKERQKKEKRVLDNWKLLTKGLKIREKLKRKYDMIKDNKKEKSSKETPEKKTKANDVKAAWPALRQAGEDKLDKTNLFPFEKL